MEIKKSREIYVMPIIFLLLFISAIPVAAIYFRFSKLYVILMFISLPAGMALLDIIYLVYIIVIPKLLCRIDNDSLYYKDLIIPLKDIEYSMVRRGILSMYHPLLMFKLKDGEILKIRNSSDPYEASKLINKKYLKLKGNPER